VLSLGGCSKDRGAAKPAPSDSVAAIASAPPIAEAGPAAGTPASSGGAVSYAGTYSISPRALYIPPSKDYGRVAQAKDDPAKHVGDGALSLAIDAEGRVSGAIESGPAAPAIIDGSLVDGEIRGNVRRKTPSDDGLTGTLLATVNADAVEGTLSHAEAHAAIVREGKLALKKK
jgi:hypothetical protein